MKEKIQIIELMAKTFAINGGDFDSISLDLQGIEFYVYVDLPERDFRIHIVAGSNLGGGHLERNFEETDLNEFGYLQDWRYDPDSDEDIFEGWSKFIPS